MTPSDSVRHAASCGWDVAVLARGEDGPTGAAAAGTAAIALSRRRVPSA